jgi:hypothetical protein
MVGKPNLPANADDAALDDDRQLSMADEGGAAGAVVESEDHQPRALARRRWGFAALGFVTAAVGLGLLIAARSRR